MNESEQIHPNAMEYDGFIENYAEINGIKIYYEFSNVEKNNNNNNNNNLKDQSAFLLVHGWTANRYRIHPLYIHLKNKGYPVFRFDLRGHGWSDKDESLDYTLTSFVNDLEQMCSKIILEEYGFHKINLIGHSMGGLIVQGLLCEYNPDYVEKVILISTSPHFFDNFIRKIGANIEVKGYRKDFDKKYKKKLHHEEGLGLEHFPQWSKKYTTKERTLIPSVNATINSILSMKNYNLKDKIKNLNIDKPVLAITGTKDILAPPRFAKWMAENYKNAEFHIIEGAEHNIDIHRPVTLHKIIDEFLEK